MEQSLGDTLRKARKASDLSIEEVSERAKIPKPVIEALEAENFGFFTSPLYARSFLRQYSEFIEADVEHWLADFVPAVMIDSDVVENILGGGPESATEHHAPTETEKSSGAIWGSIWIFLITVALIWGGVKIYEIFDTKHSDTELPENTDPVTPAATEPVPSADVENPAAEIPVEDSQAPRRAVIVEPPPAEE